MTKKLELLAIDIHQIDPYLYSHISDIESNGVKITWRTIYDLLMDFGNWEGIPDEVILPLAKKLAKDYWGS